ncbi:hypothetical protein [Phycicoccus sonneratiae]|uniref:Uncharacterized protein n=1 Tax=Phycicoccus sonneratiae TaxID=2807628 RepID=A0ABS2CKX0_9MICO|nr:hypothetical protein [Phycicoccus sonneraticus]MBM6399791.1 hypothetical protein [Phycicoccus sonneraticus]
MTLPADAHILELLVNRDGLPTLVTLENGATITVYNIAWGYDIGDEYAHVTTNVSPEVDGTAIHLFLTSEVRSISDPDSGETLG